MKLSTRARYGSRALMELAAAYPDKQVTLKEVAHKQHLSTKYLGQIMRALKAAGIVRAARGMGGGFSLIRPPGEITLSEVFSALDDPEELVECVLQPHVCPMHDVCPTRDTWVELSEAINKVLESTTLHDLVSRHRQKTSKSALTYQI